MIDDDARDDDEDGYDDEDDDDNDDDDDDDDECVWVGRWVLACSLLRGGSVEKTTKTYKSETGPKKTCRNL